MSPISQFKNQALLFEAARRHDVPGDLVAKLLDVERELHGMMRSKSPAKAEIPQRATTDTTACCGFGLRQSDAVRWPIDGCQCFANDFSHEAADFVTFENNLH
jgi:hypothetical protein